MKKFRWLPLVSRANVSTPSYATNNLNQYTSITHPGTFDLLVRASSDIAVTATNATLQAKTNQGNLYGIRMNSLNGSAGKMATTTVTLQGDATKTAAAKTWVPKASENRTYTLDGNLASDSHWTYTWDGENRLVKMTPNIVGGAPNITLWYSYDYLGRRIGRKEEDKRGPTATTITGYAYDAWNVVAELEAGATGTTQPVASTMVLKRSHVWGLDLASNGSATIGRQNFQTAGGVGGLLLSSWHDGLNSRHYLPSYDGNGNIISWTAGNGELLKRFDYDVFGNRVLDENFVSAGSAIVLQSMPPYGYSTKPTEEATGLIYYGYRHYDPAVGRWLSKDPIEERGGENLYGFVSNRTTSRVDLLGLLACKGKFKLQHIQGLDLTPSEQAATGGAMLNGFHMEFIADPDDGLNCSCCDEIVIKQAVNPPGTRGPHFDTTAEKKLENKRTKGGTRPPGYVEGGSRKGYTSDSSYIDGPIDPSKTDGGKWTIEACAYCRYDINFGGSLESSEKLIGCVTFYFDQKTRRAWTEGGSEEVPEDDLLDDAEDGWTATPGPMGSTMEDALDGWNNASGEMSER